MRPPTSSSRTASVPLAAVFGFLAAMASAAQGSGACEGDENYRALDFLLGEWRLVSYGEAVGRSQVEKLEDGCLIAETWSFTDGRGGRTYSIFDRVAGVWRRFGVSNRGVVVRLSGMVDNGALLLRGERVSADGEASTWLERWVPEAGGRIRLSAGGSAAGGRSDRVEDAPFNGLHGFDGYYEPVGRAVAEGGDSSVPATAVAGSEAAFPEVATAAERPSTPDRPASPRSAPEPVAVSVRAEAVTLDPVTSEPAAPKAVSSGPEARKKPGSVPFASSRTVEERVEPANPESVAPEPVLATGESESAAPAAGEVTPASARAADAERIERIAMASPMVLRLPLGPVEALPAGYAWITRDTAPYLCEGVTIERMEVARRRRRGQIELEVELAVHGRQVSRAVDVSVDLRRAGQTSAQVVVASGTASSRVGRSIPEQVQYGAVAVVVALAMTDEVFDSVVAEPVRPDLVITLAAGK